MKLRTILVGFLISSAVAAQDISATGRFMRDMNEGMVKMDRKMAAASMNGNVDHDFAAMMIPHHQAVSDMEADSTATLASMSRGGTPASASKVSPSALLTQSGGRYGTAHRAPATSPDIALWPAADFQALDEAFRITGFRAANSWYLNGTANLAYSRTAPNRGRLSQPVLFINGNWDANCDDNRSRLGEPMHSSCTDLFVTNMSAGHWLPLESKTELVQTIQSWLVTKKLLDNSSPKLSSERRHPCKQIPPRADTPLEFGRSRPRPLDTSGNNQFHTS